MAGINIKNIPNATSLSTEDFVIVEQTTGTKKTSINDLTKTGTVVHYSENPDTIVLQKPDMIEKVNSMQEDITKVSSQLEQKTSSIVYIKETNKDATYYTNKIQQALDSGADVQIEVDIRTNKTLTLKKSKQKIICINGSQIYPNFIGHCIVTSFDLDNINVNINGSEMPENNEDIGAIVVGFEGGNSTSTKVNSNIFRFKGHGVIHEQGSMVDYSDTRIYQCSKRGIWCTSNYNDNNHCYFANTHVIKCGDIGYYIQASSTNSDNSSRHNVFLNAKAFGNKQNFKIETQSNIGTIFSEKGTVADELTETSKGNKIDIIETTKAFVDIIDNGVGNEISGFDRYGSQATKKQKVNKQIIGNDLNIGKQYFEQVDDNLFEDSLEGTTAGLVTINHSKGSAKGRLDAFDLIKIGEVQLKNKANITYTISEDIQLAPNEVYRHKSNYISPPLDCTLIATLSNVTAGYKLSVNVLIEKDSAIVFLIQNIDTYTRNINGVQIRCVGFTHS